MVQRERIAALCTARVALGPVTRSSACDLEAFKVSGFGRAFQL